ncbi:MAG: hypothetical protein WCG27_06420 [Pseudomonadota bacterium]
MLPFIFALSLILSTSLGILSLYHKCQQSSDSLNQSFKQKTQQLIQGNKGHLSLLGVLLSLMLLTGMLSLILQAQQNFWSIKNRAQQYLCFAFLNRKTINYVEAMEMLNTAIRGSLLMATPESFTARQAMKEAQELLHLKYLTHLQQATYCRTGQNLTYLARLPYQTVSLLRLARSVDEATIPRQEKWQTEVLPSFDYLKHLTAQSKFMLIGHFNFAPNFTLQSEEMGATYD